VASEFNFNAFFLDFSDIVGAVLGCTMLACWYATVYKELKMLTISEWGVDDDSRVYRIFAAAFKLSRSVFMLLLKRCFQSVVVIGIFPQSN
jgi:hypothetical protein